MFYCTFCNALSMISRQMFFAALNDLTTLNDVHYVERFALRSMICTTLKDLWNF